MASYNYTYSGDYLQQQGINEEQLRQEIQDAIPVLLDYVLFSDPDDTVVTPENTQIVFTVSLSVGQKNDLDVVIANHIPAQGNFSREPPAARKRLYIRDVNEPTLVDNVHNGTFVLSIFNEQRNAPNTLYAMSKNRDNVEPALLRFLSVPLNQERLDVQWKPELEIEVTKNTSLYDGMYNSNLLVDKKNRRGTIIESLLVGTSYGDVLTKDFGVEMLVCDSDNTDFPSALFAICKTSRTLTPSISRIISSRNSQDFTKLDIQWDPHQGIKINKNNTNSTLDGLYFTERLRNYQVYEKIYSLTGTNYITLNGEEDITVFKYKQRFIGFILIESITEGGPCAIFTMGKNFKDQETTINRVINGNGLGTGERLEIIWPTDDFIQIRKNNTNYDGLYRITVII